MSSKQKLQTLKGFRDFYPEEMAFQKWLYKKVQKVSELYGFEEYNGPILEPLDLYAAKSGEELVKKQAYTLETKSGETITLRPEMTPSLARMVAQKEGQLTFPIRWFTYGSRFRYETPQRGRGREFFQWDIDILGTQNPESDAEIISIAAAFYKEIGLTPNEAVIKVNDRKYLQDELAKIGIEKSETAFKIIDKKEKVSKSDFEEMLKELTLTETQIGQLNKILNNLDGYKNSTWLMKIFEYLKQTELAEYVVFDPTIVRGLDYYTRTVFEGWDVKGELRSIWGGGRYDNLTSDVGSKSKIPGVGFAMGDMVLTELLKENNKYPKLKTIKTKVLVTVFDEKTQVQSIKVARQLRENNINTELYPDSEVKLDKQLKYADKKQIPWVVVIGPEEAKENKVTVKNMQSGEQQKINLTDLIALISK